MINELVMARKAKKYGMKNSLRIVREAKRASLPLSLAFAMVEQESGNGSNIWGGDPRPNGNTTGMHNHLVTKARYQLYKNSRGRTGTGGMQGVGPLQLTWWEFQDAADRLGGCWIPKYNLRIGFCKLSDLIKVHGRYNGVKRYNGVGPAAEAYAHNVVKVRMPKWHNRLLG